MEIFIPVGKSRRKSIDPDPEQGSRVYKDPDGGGVAPDLGARQPARWLGAALLRVPDLDEAGAVIRPTVVCCHSSDSVCTL